MFITGMMLLLSSAIGAPTLSTLSGTAVSTANQTVLLVAASVGGGDGLASELEAIKRARKPDEPKLQSLVVVVDLQGIPGFLHGVAIDTLKEREAKAREKNPYLDLHIVADPDGVEVARLRQLQGQALELPAFVRLDADGVPRGGRSLKAIQASGRP